MWHIYILDMWHMSCCQCADRGNGTNLYILLCPCLNALHCTGALSCPFCCSDPRSLQQCCHNDLGFCPTSCNGSCHTALLHLWSHWLNFQKMLLVWTGLFQWFVVCPVLYF